MRGFEYGKTAAFTANDNDRELWKILVDVPKLKNSTPYVCGVLNVGLPGIGTMVAACLGDPMIWSKTQLAIGLLQMLTSVFIIGWLWSIYWAFLFVKRARQDAKEVENFVERSN